MVWNWLCTTEVDWSRPEVPSVLSHFSGNRGYVFFAARGGGGGGGKRERESVCVFFIFFMLRAHEQIADHFGA